MAIRDVSGAAVYISPNNGAGTYTRIEDMTSWDGTHGSEGSTRTRVFGKADPYVRAGDNTDEYSLEGLYNPEDTNGQNILRDAKDAGSDIYIAILDDETAETGYTQKIKVTEYTDSGAADGEYIQCTFSAEGNGSRVEITALP